MPEIRKDPVTNTWVIISAEREGRPTDYVVEEKIIEDFYCPFCPGNEANTPSPSYERVGGVGNWNVRVVPNKFPVLRHASLSKKETRGIYETVSGVGEHDVVIEHRDHAFTYYSATTDDMKEIVIAIKERMSALSKEPYINYSVAFKNYKHSAGATLSHSHSQIISTPIIPVRIAEEIAHSQDYYRRTSSCLFCAMIRQEKSEEERAIYENEHFLLFAPFASRSPFEVCIIPIRHGHAFDPTDYAETLALADAMHVAFKKLHAVLNDAPFNLSLHAAPFHEEGDRVRKFYHWHIEIAPKLNKLAGFEWSSGVYINSFAPEYAAARLKEARV